MKTAWTKGLEPDAAKDMKGYFEGGYQLRGRLTHIITDKIDSKERECKSVSEYEKPNWAFKQADAVGYKRAMTEILSLIENNSK